MTTACITNAFASACRLAPIARATADEMPPPIAPADIICINISAGNTSATPASASVPSRPTQYALDESDRRLSEQQNQIRRCKSQQRAHNRAFEEHARAPVESRWRGRSGRGGDCATRHRCRLQRSSRQRLLRRQHSVC